MTTAAEQREANKLAQRRRRQNPGVRAADSERMRRLRADPAYRAKEKKGYRRVIVTKEGWAKYALSRIKHRAKKRGLDFDLTAADLQLPDFCPVLGIRLTPGIGTDAWAFPSAPSVDRFDNSKGYVRGNIRVISNRANILKCDATASEMFAILQYMLGGGA